MAEGIKQKLHASLFTLEGGDALEKCKMDGRTVWTCWTRREGGTALHCTAGRETDDDLPRHSERRETDSGASQEAALIGTV